MSEIKTVNVNFEKMKVELEVKSYLFGSNTNSGIKWIQKDRIFSIRNFRKETYL